MKSFFQRGGNNNILNHDNQHHQQQQQRGGGGGRSNGSANDKNNNNNYPQDDDDDDDDIIISPTNYLSFSDPLAASSQQGRNHGRTAGDGVEACYYCSSDDDDHENDFEGGGVGDDDDNHSDEYNNNYHGFSTSISDMYYSADNERIDCCSCVLCGIFQSDRDRYLLTGVTPPTATKRIYVHFLLPFLMFLTAGFAALNVSNTWLNSVISTGIIILMVCYIYSQCYKGRTKHLHIRKELLYTKYQLQKHGLLRYQMQEKTSSSWTANWRKKMISSNAGRNENNQQQEEENGGGGSIHSVHSRLVRALERERPRDNDDDEEDIFAGGCCQMLCCCCTASCCLRGGDDAEEEGSSLPAHYMGQTKVDFRNAHPSCCIGCYPNDTKKRQQQQQRHRLPFRKQAIISPTTTTSTKQQLAGKQQRRRRRRRRRQRDDNLCSKIFEYTYCWAAADQDDVLAENNNNTADGSGKSSCRQCCGQYCCCCCDIAFPQLFGLCALAQEGREIESVLLPKEYRRIDYITMQPMMDYYPAIYQTKYHNYKGSNKVLHDNDDDSNILSMEIAGQNVSLGIHPAASNTIKRTLSSTSLASTSSSKRSSSCLPALSQLSIRLLQYLLTLFGGLLIWCYLGPKYYRYMMGENNMLHKHVFGLGDLFVMLCTFIHPIIILYCFNIMASANEKCGCSCRCYYGHINPQLSFDAMIKYFACGFCLSTSLAIFWELVLGSIVKMIVVLALTFNGIDQVTDPAEQQQQQASYSSSFLSTFSQSYGSSNNNNQQQGEGNSNEYYDINEASSSSSSSIGFASDVIMGGGSSGRRPTMIVLRSLLSTLSSTTAADTTKNTNTAADESNGFLQVFGYDHPVIYTMYLIVSAFILAALVEELCKYFGYRMIEHPDFLSRNDIQRAAKVINKRGNGSGNNNNDNNINEANNDYYFTSPNVGTSDNINDIEQHQNGYRVHHDDDDDIAAPVVAMTMSSRSPPNSNNSSIERQNASSSLSSPRQQVDPEPTIFVQQSIPPPRLLSRVRQRGDNLTTTARRSSTMTKVGGEGVVVVKDGYRHQENTYQGYGSAITMAMISTALGFTCCENLVYIFAYNGSSLRMELSVLAARIFFPVHPIAAALQSIGVVKRDVEEPAQRKLNYYNYYNNRTTTTTTTNARKNASGNNSNGGMNEVQHPSADGGGGTTTTTKLGSIIFSAVLFHGMYDFFLLLLEFLIKRHGLYEADADYANDDRYYYGEDDDEDDREGGSNDSRDSNDEQQKEQQEEDERGSSYVYGAGQQEAYGGDGSSSGGYGYYEEDSSEGIAGYAIALTLLSFLLSVLTMVIALGYYFNQSRLQRVRLHELDQIRQQQQNRWWSSSASSASSILT